MDLKTLRLAKCRHLAGMRPLGRSCASMSLRMGPKAARK